MNQSPRHHNTKKRSYMSKIQSSRSSDDDLPFPSLVSFSRFLTCHLEWNMAFPKELTKRLKDTNSMNGWSFFSGAILHFVVFENRHDEC